jgi:hypothetical protein
MAALEGFELTEGVDLVGLGHNTGLGSLFSHGDGGDGKDSGAKTFLDVVGLGYKAQTQCACSRTAQSRVTRSWRYGWWR